MKCAFITTFPAEIELGLENGYLKGCFTTLSSIQQSRYYPHGINYTISLVLAGIGKLSN